MLVEVSKLPTNEIAKRTMRVLGESTLKIRFRENEQIHSSELNVYIEPSSRGSVELIIEKNLSVHVQDRTHY